MLKLTNLIRPATLEEAYDLLQHPGSLALAGGTLSQLQEMGGTGVELAPLLESTITAEGETIRIGAMATLRSLEVCPLLAEGPLSILPSSVSHLLGPAFRNLATVGGSVGARLPQSELLTALLALDAKVVLYGRGTISMEEWLTDPKPRDLVLAVTLEREQGTAGFRAVRNSYTDTAMLCAAARKRDGAWRIAVGARPGGALLFSHPVDREASAIAEYCAARTPLEGNLLVSKAYREQICSAVIRSAMEEERGCK